MTGGAISLDVEPLDGDEFESGQGGNCRSIEVGDQLLLAVLDKVRVVSAIRRYKHVGLREQLLLSSSRVHRPSRRVMMMNKVTCPLFQYSD